VHPAFTQTWLADLADLGEDQLYPSDLVAPAGTVWAAPSMLGSTFPYDLGYEQPAIFPSNGNSDAQEVSVQDTEVASLETGASSSTTQPSDSTA